MILQKCSISEYGKHEKVIDLGYLSQEQLPEGLKINFFLEKKIKRGEICRVEFTKKYLEALNANAQEIVNWFINLSKKYNEIYLTSPNNNEFCHCDILIQWLEGATDGTFCKSQ